jgi:hypothetical protein|tara:strand:+ start:80 stop:556 length:477 start_codon:yes stop_codon:yes gene_type:complete
LARAHGIRINVVKATVVGIAGIVAALACLFILLSISKSSDSIEIRLGDDDFRGIDALNLSNEISSNGPVLFPDLLGRDRPIWVTHTGTDPQTGWFAFLAQVPKQADSCLTQWDYDNSNFFNSCDPTNKFPPDGTGLQQLTWQVVKGELRILINTEKNE